jgi:hypothetical protein
MQFSVPQFTDVEDRIVAGLTFRQFGIVFGAGVVVFVFFTLTKSVAVTIASAIIIGIPAIIVAFGKVNGRPIYTGFGNLLRFAIGPKLYVFHKEAQALDEKQIRDIKAEQPLAPIDNKSAVVRIKKLNYLLQQQASEEQLLLQRIAEEKVTKQNG